MEPVNSDQTFIFFLFTPFIGPLDDEKRGRRTTLVLGYRHPIILGVNKRVASAYLVESNLNGRRVLPIGSL
jgi:hypothetical protein